MPGKLTKNSKPVRTLVSWLQSGKLSANENAKDVQASSQLFSPYKLATFRTRWNALRQEYGKHSGTLNLHVLEKGFILMFYF